MSPQNSPPPLVRDRILGLIQSWADAFRGKPELQAAVDVYEQLKDEGREFPPLDLDALAPINTPHRVSVLYLEEPPPSSLSCVCALGF